MKVKLKKSVSCTADVLGYCVPNDRSVPKEATDNYFTADIPGMMLQNVSDVTAY